MSGPPPLHRQGTAIAWLGRGILFTGPPGAGKSSLALRCIGAGAYLVADDLVRLRPLPQGVRAEPVALPGHLEIRGLGIVKLPRAPATLLARVVALQAGGAEERLPAREHEELLGWSLPRLRLDPGRADAVSRLKVALFARLLDELPCPAA